MTIAQLRTFMIVAQSKSFTVAAKQQYISQPAVSRQMAALETELGAELFDRTRNTIQLTSAGQHLARHLFPILEHLDALLNQVNEIGEGQSGSLTFGLLVDQSMDTRISRALQWFRQSHNVTISLLRLDIMEMLSALKSGVIDIAISIESTPDMFNGCEKFIYAQESMCFAARRDLMQRVADTRDEEMIFRVAEQVPVLLPKLDCFPRNDQEALQQNLYKLPLHCMEQEYDLASIAPMVSAGLAATAVNESHSLAMDQSIMLLPCEGLSKINKGIFWMADNSNPLVEQFYACIRDVESGPPIMPPEY